MRCHKKTKESGFFESYSDSDGENMGKAALKRTKVFTISSDYKRKVCDKVVEYTTEELESHIRSTEYSRLGTFWFWFWFWFCANGRKRNGHVIARSLGIGGIVNNSLRDR